MQIQKFKFSVAYADTDAGGIMYHGRYIEIAERARMAWLGKTARPVPTDVGLVIRELHIKYMRPLFLADEFVVETVVTAVGAASVSVEQKFVKNNEICAILTGTAAYLNGDGRPVRMPDVLKDALCAGLKK
ncbi:MAG: acyl-CoA thioesterase [Alphaproteobacteria bacterium]|nr:acyl-CoA thioesterase [Alphaproteobacteria bacterium]